MRRNEYASSHLRKHELKLGRSASNAIIGFSIVVIRESRRRPQILYLDLGLLCLYSALQRPLSFASGMIYELFNLQIVRCPYVSNPTHWPMGNISFPFRVKWRIFQTVDCLENRCRFNSALKFLRCTTLLSKKILTAQNLENVTRRLRSQLARGRIDSILKRSRHDAWRR